LIFSQTWAFPIVWPLLDANVSLGDRYPTPSIDIRSLRARTGGLTIYRTSRPNARLFIPSVWVRVVPAAERIVGWYSDENSWAQAT